jgi:phosphatidylserine/phosphatidylglycerophosphate/cardiolipin synthase-like enzyme
LVGGIAVSLDAPHAWAHDKVVIADGVTVSTGSYNWTVAAEQQNGENRLVICEARLAELYAEDWRRHAHHSSPYSPKAPWWVRLHVVWGCLTRRRHTRWHSDVGEDV